MADRVAGLTDRPYRTLPGDVLPDWQRGPRVVEQVWRGEDLGVFSDGSSFRASSIERCALHGGRRATFQVKD